MEVPRRQTVPRAELWAVVQAQRAAKMSIHQHKYIWSDSLYIVRGSNIDSKDQLLRGTNGDLWLVAAADAVWGLAPRRAAVPVDEGAAAPAAVAPQPQTQSWPQKIRSQPLQYKARTLQKINTQAGPHR